MTDEALLQRVACRLRQSGLYTDAKMADELEALTRPAPADVGELVSEIETLLAAYRKPDSETSAAFALRSHLVANVDRILTALRGAQGWRWSFDDLHIGKLKKGDGSLVTREIDRPKGLSNSAWYAHASAVCKLMPLPPAPERGQ